MPVRAIKEQLASLCCLCRRHAFSRSSALWPSSLTQCIVFDTHFQALNGLTLAQHMNINDRRAIRTIKHERRRRANPWSIARVIHFRKRMTSNGVTLPRYSLNYGRWSNVCLSFPMSDRVSMSVFVSRPYIYIDRGRVFQVENVMWPSPTRLLSDDSRPTKARRRETSSGSILFLEGVSAQVDDVSS